MCSWLITIRSCGRWLKDLIFGSSSALAIRNVRAVGRSSISSAQEPNAELRWIHWPKCEILCLPLSPKNSLRDIFFPFFGARAMLVTSLHRDRILRHRTHFEGLMVLVAGLQHSKSWARASIAFPTPWEGDAYYIYFKLFRLSIVPGLTVFNYIRNCNKHCDNDSWIGSDGVEK